MKKPFFKSRFFWALAITLILVSLFLWWGLGTILPRYSELPVVHHNQYPESDPKTKITVATYNIGHGQGIKNDPTDWRDEAYTRNKMEELSSVVKKINADILFLQEVDINSDRTHNINQANYLIEAGRYPFSACAIVWDKNYIPFPFWPIDKHLGRVQTANCVLSKFPISWHKRIIFEKPASNPFWYNWGYLDRGAHRIDVKIGERNLIVINLHLEAYEQAAREKQAKYIQNWITKMKGPILIGGDFNSIPHDATVKRGFIDEPEVSFDTDQTLELVKMGLGTHTDALGNCATKENTCHTFPADRPTRRLDHLFAAKGAHIVSGRVFLEAQGASDHLPVIAELEFIPQS